MKNKFKSEPSGYSIRVRYISTPCCSPHLSLSLVSCYNHLLISNITVVAMEAETCPSPRYQACGFKCAIRNKTRRKLRVRERFTASQQQHLCYTLSSRPNRMQPPDNSGEIIWMLDRMMSLCVSVH